MKCGIDADAFLCYTKERYSMRTTDVRMMKKEFEKSIRKTIKNRPGRFLFLFVLFLFAFTDGQSVATYAKTQSVSTVEEIRVGLKSNYANKKSITIQNTALEFGFCNGREYCTERVLLSETGVRVTAEQGDYFASVDTYELHQAEEMAEKLSTAGAKAYAVSFSSGKAGIYFPVEENGGTTEAAREICDKAGSTCGIRIEEKEKKSLYLIRIDAGEQVLFADGIQGMYPQFAATEKNDEGVFAINMGKRSYRGRIEIGRYGGRSTVTAVNVVGLEEYLYGVVPCEMPASWSMEALKAQAVCARSYALTKAGYRAGTDITRGFRMEDTIQSQVYGGLDFEHSRSTAAVNATKGKTLCYENRMVAGYYFSASGGHTENIEDVWGVSVPYLQGVPDLYESEPSKKPWTVTLKKTELERLLQAEGKDVGTVRKVVQEITTSSGRVTSLRIIGSNKTVSLATSDLRNVLELPSTKFKVVNGETTSDTVMIQGDGALKEAPISECYVISDTGDVEKVVADKQYVVISEDNLTGFGTDLPDEDEVLFVGMGHGHGVGLSQSGANGMGNHGFSYEEILEHYFTGITVR